MHGTFYICLTPPKTRFNGEVVVWSPSCRYIATQYVCSTARVAVSNCKAIAILQCSINHLIRFRFYLVLLAAVSSRCIAPSMHVRPDVV